VYTDNPPDTLQDPDNRQPIKPYIDTGQNCENPGEAIRVDWSHNTYPSGRNLCIKFITSYSPRPLDSERLLV